MSETKEMPPRKFYWRYTDDRGRVLEDGIQNFRNSDAQVEYLSLEEHQSILQSRDELIQEMKEALKLAASYADLPFYSATMNHIEAVIKKAEGAKA